VSINEKILGVSKHVIKFAFVHWTKGWGKAWKIIAREKKKQFSKFSQQNQKILSAIQMYGKEKNN